MSYSYKIYGYHHMSVGELLEKKRMGIPVTLTSHAGNSSLYKLSLWSCGITETIWDITCIVADKNNQPAYILRDGQKHLLLNEKVFAEIKAKTSADRRYITAYQQANNGDRLGRIHVRAMAKCFPNSNVSLRSQSRLLLKHKENVQIIFEYLASRDANLHFPRHINSDGIMTPYFHMDKLSAEKISESCVNVLTELEQLIFSDEKIITKGGVTYGFPLVPVIASLCDYWSCDSNVRYDISDPDMIHYSLAGKYQKSASLLLDCLHKQFPTLVPKSFEVFMSDGTVFRTGNRVIEARDSEFDLLCDQILNQQLIRREKQGGQMIEDEKYESMKSRARELCVVKPFYINSAVDSYYSQHDGNVSVSEVFIKMPLSEIEERYAKLKNILRI